MSGAGAGPWSALAVAGAGLLFLLYLALSVALAAVSAVSRVALHRLCGENGGRLLFLEGIRDSSSAQRTATVLLRQLALLGGTLLLLLALDDAGQRHAVSLGFVLAGVGGVLVTDLLLARTVALWNPRRALRATAVFIRVADVLLFPLVRPMRGLWARLERGQYGSEEEREEEQDEEVEALIEVGEREGLLEAEEGEMMRGIVDLDETLVRELMTPRTDIVALPAETPVREARRLFLEAGHSKLPVYHESIDNVVGVLHSRDLFLAWEEGQEDRPVGQYLRPTTFVPETLTAAELLAEMREKTQIALVVDEYGGTAGLVTLEDVLEEIVGEIRDEHDDEEVLVRKEGEASWIVSAVAHVEEIEELFGVEFEPRGFDTVGGLVVSSFGRVPEQGETIEVRGIRLEVLRADPRRVYEVRVRAAGEGEAERS